MRRPGTKIRPKRRFKFKSSLKIILFGLAVFLFALANKSGLSAADERTGTVIQHVVKSGDTYWQLAERYYPDQDPREMSHQLKNWNQKSSGQLRPGEIILIYHE